MFKPGDRCMIVVPPHQPPHNGAPLNGEIITLTSAAGIVNNCFAWNFAEAPLNGRYGPVLAVEELCLRKIDDDEEYDGNETTTWDDCPFKPKELVHANQEN